MSNIEEHINQAMQAGKFDNLKGKGKKLDLDDNPLVDPEWRLAHQMLHSSGFTLPWIENRQRLEGEITAARAALRQAWAWRAQARISGNYSPDLISTEWKRATERFQSILLQLNPQIRSYNLEAPSERVHLPILNFDREIARLEVNDQETNGL